MFGVPRVEEDHYWSRLQGFRTEGSVEMGEKSMLGLLESADGVYSFRQGGKQDNGRYSAAEVLEELEERQDALQEPTWNVYVKDPVFRRGTAIHASSSQTVPDETAYSLDEVDPHAVLYPTLIEGLIRAPYEDVLGQIK